MATGSLKVVNDSKTITGTGTAFADELGRGDFVVFTVSTVTYTLAVNAVDNDKITLAKPYTGPSADDVPFSIVPVGTGSMVTTELVAQITEALRGMNADKKIWQSVFSEEADMTITLPDGQTFTGPSWLHIVNAVKEVGGDELIATVETVREAVANVENNRASVEKTVTDAKADIASTIATGKDDMLAIADAAAASAGAAAGSEGAAAASANDAAEQAEAAANSATAAEESSASAENSASSAKTDADRAATEADKLENWNDLAGAIDKVTDKDVAWKGAMKVGREAAADFELVTLRQLISATSTGGAGGPTMNGVMNNSLGCVEWFNGTRAKMWPGYQAADGQCLSRAKNPEVWAAIAAGVFNAVDESLWIAPIDANGYSNRASYSKGGEAGTCPDDSIKDAWFRLPDLNGAQEKSVMNGFLRGSGPGNGNVGRTHQDGAPNITGSAGTVIDGVVFLPTGPFSGALASTGRPSNVLANVPNTNEIGEHDSGIVFDASRSYAGYGRSAAEIRPSASIGIWVIRVNGIFTVSDTIFNVINADEILPDSGAIVYGGAVQSLYQAAGKDQVFARMRSKYNIGNGHKSIVLDIVDNTVDSVTTKSWEFRDDGAFSCPNMTTFRNSIDLGQSSVPWFGSMELRSKTPFIDFHYDNTDADYDVRIINDDAGVLSIAHQDGVSTRLRLAGGYQCRQGVKGGFNNNSFNFYWNEQARLEAWIDVTNVGDVMLNGTRIGTVEASASAPGNPAIGAYLNAASLRSTLLGRGGFYDPRGCYVGLYVQEHVGTMAAGILNFNGFGEERNWQFRQDGTLMGGTGELVAGGSDVRLKSNITPAADGAGARIDQIGVVEFEWIANGKKERGYIAQQLDYIDELYTSTGGEGTDESGENFEILNVKDRAVVADLVVCVQELRQQVADLQAEVKKLKAAK